MDVYIDGSGQELPGTENFRDFVAFQGAVCDAEARSVTVSGVLDSLDAEDRGPALDLLARKLARGGVLTIIGLDVAYVGRELTGRRMSLQEAVAVLYGTGGPATRVRSATGLAEVASQLESRGLVLEAKSFEGAKYLVSARRPA